MWSDGEIEKEEKVFMEGKRGEQELKRRGPGGHVGCGVQRTGHGRFGVCAFLSRTRWEPTATAFSLSFVVAPNSIVDPISLSLSPASLCSVASIST